ncbi:MAG: DUF3825 domain-containing protein, partial [Clostridia bacterium]|nr:DUF3825 domain-containing protein [Clostridia bacterium]
MMCSAVENSIKENLEGESNKVEGSEIDYSDIYQYAYMGSQDNIERMFETLSAIAEEECWSFDEDNPNSILKYYIFHTFSQCMKQDKVLESADGQLTCFNTGLLTKNGNDIIALFSKNRIPDHQQWALKGFFDRCYREIMDYFPNIPEIATYDDDSQDTGFHLEDSLVLNLDHILDDNWDRIHDLIPFEKSVTKTLLVGVVEEAKAKIKRNKRLVIPQYFKDEIMYLIPIVFPIDDKQSVTMALAVEKTETGQYRANTILTRE